MYLSKNWWGVSGDKVTLLSGRSGRIGHVSINQLGVFLLRESRSVKNYKMYSHLPHTVDRDIIKLMGRCDSVTKICLARGLTFCRRVG